MITSVDTGSLTTYIPRVASQYMNPSLKIVNSIKAYAHTKIVSNLPESTIFKKDGEII